MELVLTRIAKRKTYTIGRLAIVERIDDEYLAGSQETYFCDTLEPTWRDYAHGGRKIKGCSAIPEGRYAVVISWSPKMQKCYPSSLVSPCSAASASMLATPRTTPKAASSWVRT